MKLPTCVMLVGGLGTRLRSVVSDRPKPMADVGGAPFLETLLKRLASQGVREFVLCVGYRADAIESFFGDGQRYGVRIQYSRESSPLGTAGAISHARNLIESDPFIAMNGDSSCPVLIRDLLACHESCGVAATLAVVPVDDRQRYGSVTLDDDRRIMAFREKGQDTGPGFINGGVYVLRKSVLDRIPTGGPSSIERDVFPTLCNGDLQGFCVSGEFIDIGTPDELKRAATLWSHGENR